MRLHMKIKKGFVLEKVGGSYLAVATGANAKSFSGLVRMNETGAFLWHLIENKDMSADEMINAVLAEYDVPRDVAERDVMSFEEKLRNGGILE